MSQGVRCVCSPARAVAMLFTRVPGAPRCARSSNTLIAVITPSHTTRFSSRSRAATQRRGTGYEVLVSSHTTRAQADTLIDVAIAREWRDHPDNAAPTPRRRRQEAKTGDSDFPDRSRNQRLAIAVSQIVANNYQSGYCRRVRQAALRKGTYVELVSKESTPTQPFAAAAFTTSSTSIRSSKLD